MRRARVIVAVAERALREQVRRRVDEAAPSVVTEVANGPDAFEAAIAGLPDLLVTAADLPGLDGLALCHRLRGIPALADMPVVVLGPRGDQRRKYQAFYVGATEYVEVPFDGVELAYRVRVQLRGLLRERDAHEALSTGQLTLEPATRVAALPDRRVVLTPSEFAVLRHLVTRAGRPVAVDELLAEALRRPGGLGNPQLIHTHVRNLRKKLEVDPDQPARLVRHPAGYMWVEPAAG